MMSTPLKMFLLFVVLMALDVFFAWWWFEGVARPSFALWILHAVWSAGTLSVGFGSLIGFLIERSGGKA